MGTSIVTGGAGFIGSHIVDELVKRGKDVVVVDNLSTGRLSNVADSISSGRVTFVYADVAVNVSTMRSILDQAGIAGKIDTIYHFASPSGSVGFSAQPWAALSVNSLGTMSLIDIAIERDARFVFASTSEIYGDPLVHPQPETYSAAVDLLSPRACYNESKRFGEVAVGVAARSRGLDARVVRFFNCYGPRMANSEGQLVPELLEAALRRRPFQIHGSGMQTRSLTYVADAVELLMLVVSARPPSLMPVNVGGDDERSVLEIATTLAEMLSIDFAPEFRPAREGDPRQRRPELTRARSFGWSPKTSLEQGLRLTYDWYAKDSQIFV